MFENEFCGGLVFGGSGYWVGGQCREDPPEGGEDHDSGYEGDERSGVAHGVDLSEGGEVACLRGDTEKAK